MSRDYGRLILEGEFKYRKANSSAMQEKLRHVMLLDKIVLISTTLVSDGASVTPTEKRLSR